VQTGWFNILSYSGFFKRRDRAILEMAPNPSSNFVQSAAARFAEIGKKSLLWDAYWVRYNINMENKLKHLEFIQSVVNRLATGSFLIKGWVITIVAALFALFINNINQSFILITAIPIFAFWILDGYFLGRERAFRSLYDSVRHMDSDKIDFSMDITNFKSKNNSWFRSLFSWTLLLFYLSLAGAMVATCLMIR